MCVYMGVYGVHVPEAMQSITDVQKKSINYRN